MSKNKFPWKIHLWGNWYLAVVRCPPYRTPEGFIRDFHPIEFPSFPEGDSGP